MKRPTGPVLTLDHLHRPLEALNSSFEARSPEPHKLTDRPYDNRTSSLFLLTSGPPSDKMRGTSENVSLADRSFSL